MGEYKPEEGSFNVGAVRIAVIAARWNSEVTDGLLAGAVRALSRHGVSDDALEVFKLPPLAQAAVELNTAPFKVPEVVLYQICPSAGLAGSEAKTSIFVPCISLYVAIIF